MNNDFIYCSTMKGKCQMINYIVLEGIEMYVFIFLVFIIAITGLIGLISSINGDFKADKLRAKLYEEREKNISLNRDNMRLKLKCGELKVGEKVDV